MYIYIYIYIYICTRLATVGIMLLCKYLIQKKVCGTPFSFLYNLT